jgi:hypothetical protein
MPPLPAEGDPYKEIYLSPAWYGLVPDHNLGLMDPSGKKAGERKQRDSLAKN